MELLISVKSSESDTVTRTQCTLNGSLILGRGPESPLMLDATGISREHLRLHSDSNRIFVTDLSSNGTWVNSQRLTRDEPHPLTPADSIRIPGFELRVEIPTTGTTTDPLAPPPQQEVSKPAIESRESPAPARGARFAASLSLLELLLIALAVITLTLVVLYIAA